MLRPASVILVCLLLHPCGLARAQEAPPTRLPVDEKALEKLLRTDWYGVYVLENKVGWARITFARTEDAGAPVYRLEHEASLKLTDGGKRELKMHSVNDFDAKPPYAFRGGWERETDGPSTQEIRLTPQAKGFDVLIEAGGEKIRKQIPAPDYTLADLTTVHAWIRRGPKPGDTLVTRTFEFDDLKVTEEVRKLTGEKTTVVDGVKLTYLEIEVTIPKDKITGTERYDLKGEQLLSMKLAGLFDMRVEPEKAAKNTTFSGDLFELGKVKVDKKLGDPEKVTGLILKTAGNSDLQLKSGPRQTVERDKDGVWVIKLGKAHDTPTKATAKEIEDNLAETATYPLSHEKVQALAKKAVGDAQTPEEKVKRLVRFVAGYIKPSYTAQPLTLLDLLKKREGDCSEYALLFTTLARAAGIPAREASGLGYMGDDEKAFGFHAWNEVVLDGHWVPVDAAWNETDLSATHISFGSSHGEAMVNMLAALRKMSFQVVEVKHGK